VADWARRWRTLRRLAWAERLLIGRGWSELWGITAALRLFGFRAVYRALARGAQPAAPVEDLERAQAVARCTAVAAHYHPLRPTCLPRALLLWRLLRRRGLQAQLHIGAQHAPNEAPTRLRAHAWVTHAGTVLNDAPDVGERFAVLPLETALAEMDHRAIGDGRTPLETARIQWLQRRWNPQAPAPPLGTETAALAEDPFVAPLLYAALKEEPGVPPDALAALRQAYEQNGLRNALLLHELGQALRALATAGVPALALKGAALAESVYGNVALRPMRDMDVLVRAEDAPRALRVLAAQGYRPEEAEPHAGVTLAYENELLLRKAGRLDFVLEVHWSLLDSPFYQHALQMDWFWATAVPVRIGGQPAHMLGPAAQLVYLCAHAVLHHGGRDLLWLHDVAALLQHAGDDLDWEAALAAAQANHLVLPLQQVLAELTTAWGVRLPERVWARVQALRPSPQEQQTFARLTAAERPVLRRFWDDLAGQPSWRRRVHYALVSLFPSPAYMRRRYGLRWLPLAYPYRWWVGLRGERNTESTEGKRNAESTEEARRGAEGG